ncbi:MAG: hypothetical protein ONA69_08820, partial [candidate division KSB1 bacterium]|nr:hypothetical protein [candidate division KSB1 bacterium]
SALVGLTLWQSCKKDLPEPEGGDLLHIPYNPQPFFSTLTAFLPTRCRIIWRHGDRFCMKATVCRSIRWSSS